MREKTPDPLSNVDKTSINFVRFSIVYLSTRLIFLNYATIIVGFTA